MKSSTRAMVITAKRKERKRVRKKERRRERKRVGKKKVECSVIYF